MAAKTIDGNGTVSLGNMGGSRPGVMAVQFDVDGTFDGSMVIKSRVAGATSAPWETAHYLDNSDGAKKNAAITADLVVLVLGSGLDIAVDTTGWTTGATTVYTSVATGA